MAIERRNPLPVGKYWVDVFDPHIADFRTWLSNHSESVTVDKEESEIARGGNPAHNWYLFSVTSETPWEGPGLPTIATEETQSKEDTGERGPPEKSGVEVIEETVEKAGNFLILGVLAAGAYVAYRIIK